MCSDIEDGAEDEDATGWWHTADPDGGSDGEGGTSQAGGTAAEAGAGVFVVEWGAQRDGDLAELKQAEGNLDGWRCRLGERLAACRR